MGVTNVLLADDHEIVLESLSLLISRMEGIEIVGAVSNGREALDFLEHNKVNIVLADLAMPILNGVGLVAEIRERRIETRIILLTMVDEVGQIRDAIRNGVDGYLLKKSNRVEVEQAIRTVAAGLPYFSPAITLQLAQIPDEKSTTGKLQTAQIESLTSRELEILFLIIQELTNIQIAEQLFISPLTVETHRKNIFRKLEVNTALGLMRYALKNGMIAS